MTATVATRPSAVFHSPSDIESALGERIVGARPLAQATDASLIRLETVSGARWVYKGQWGPSMEIPFYRKARSPLLPRCLPLLEEPERSALLIEYIEAPLLARHPLDGEAALALSVELPQRLQTIEGDPPVLERLDTPAAWRAFFVRTTGNLRALGESGVIEPVAQPLLGELDRIADLFDASPVLAGPSGLIHSDLHSENVFAMADGTYRVIDWQRPRVAPLVVDTAYLLETLGCDPLDHVNAMAVVLVHLLRLGDSVLCLRDAGPDPTGLSERHLTYRVSGILGLA